MELAGDQLWLLWQLSLAIRASSESGSIFLFQMSDLMDLITFGGIIHFRSTFMLLLSVFFP